MATTRIRCLFAFVLVFHALSAAAMPMDMEANTTADRLRPNNLTYPTNYYGVDVSQLTSKDGFACLKGLNLRFAVIRCYQSVGRVDPNCAASVANAHAGGMDRVDAYLFPCPRCGNPSGQVKALLSYFEAHHVDVTRLWLDIEGTQYWMGNYNDNRAFYQGLVDACTGLGLKTGVYSSYYQWTGLFGSAAYSYGSHLPLWFADYDGVPTFGDFRAFGGWAAPTAKQFSDQGSKCGVSYDINWRPSL